MSAVMCANCGEHEGTIQWGDALSVTHGFAQMWCEGCALEKQIEHAQERANALPSMRLALAEFRSSHPKVAA